MQIFLALKGTLDAKHANLFKMLNALKVGLFN